MTECSEEYRILIIDEENDTVLTNTMVDEDLAEQLSVIVEDGEIDSYEECEQVCSKVTEMLESIGVECDGDHDEMLKALNGLMLVKKEKIKPEKKIKVKEIKPEKVRKILTRKLIRK